MMNSMINPKGICRIGIVILLSCVTYYIADDLELFMAFLSNPILRYVILTFVLLIGYSSEKITLLPMLYVRYRNMYKYIEKQVIIRGVLYLGFSMIISISLIRHYSFPLFFVFLLLESCVFTLFDFIGRIIGIMCKQRVSGYVMFIILYGVLELLSNNMNFSMLNRMFANILCLPFAFPIKTVAVVVIALNFISFVIYAYQIKYIDKMVSLL